MCWKARDEYHACLDANEENNALCQDKFKVYETVCTPTWVINDFHRLNHNSMVNRDGLRYDLLTNHVQLLIQIVETLRGTTKTKAIAEESDGRS